MASFFLLWFNTCVFSNAASTEGFWVYNLVMAGRILCYYVLPPANTLQTDSTVIVLQT